MQEWMLAVSGGGRLCVWLMQDGEGGVLAGLDLLGVGQLGSRVRGHGCLHAVNSGLPFVFGYGISGWGSRCAGGP